MQWCACACLLGFHDTTGGSLFKHADVRVLWHKHCGHRDRVDIEMFLDAVRQHLAAASDPTVDPVAVLDLLSGDNRADLASALDADSSGQVRA